MSALESSSLPPGAHPLAPLLTRQNAILVGGFVATVIVTALAAIHPSPPASSPPAAYSAPAPAR